MTTPALTLGRAALGCALLAFTAATHAATATLDTLTNKDARSGLRAALNQGIEAAVGRLGVQDGFFGNPLVRIPSHLVLLGRTLGLLSGLARRLDAGVDPMSIVFPYIVGSAPLAQPAA
mgnify:CR=1 FL=1